MRSRLRTLLALCLTFLLGPGLAEAGPYDLVIGTGTSIDGLHFGTHHAGAEVGRDDVRGKVVMLAIWGT